MRIGRRWLAIPATLALAALAYLWHSWGLSGVSGLVLLLAVLLGGFGQVVVAVRGGDRPLPSRLFLKKLLVLLAFPAAAGLLAGFFLYERVELDLGVGLVFLALIFLVPCAFIASALSQFRPASENLRGGASSLWTIVLSCVVFCACALPVGWTRQSLALDRAKSWVEAAAAEVRAVEQATGRVPETLDGILPRLGPAPDLLRRPGFGYVPGPGAGEFEFRVREPGGMFADGWTFDGQSGRWSYESD